MRTARPTESSVRASGRCQGSGADVCNCVSKPFRILEQRASCDEHIRACLGSSSDGLRSDTAVHFDVDAVLQTGSCDHLSHLADLGLHRLDVLLTAEAGVDGHHQDHVDKVQHMLHGLRRGGWIEGDACLGAEGADVGQRPMEVCARLGVHDEKLAPGLDVPSRQHIGSEHHQVSLERERRMSAGTGDDVRPEREVRHELTIHHVPLNPVDAGLVEGKDGFAERREIHGQDGRRDLDGTMHHFHGTDPRRRPVSHTNDKAIRSQHVSTVRLSPTHMVVGGDALAREDSGRVVFVAGALPGEIVDAEVRRAKKDFASADVVAVLKPSPHRVTPPCVAWHRGCGGCDWQHIEPTAQLQLKVDIVREALQRTGRLSDPVVIEGGALNPWNYRTTIRLAADSRGGLGFRSRRSHEIVPTNFCPVAHMRINDVLREGAVDGRCPPGHDLIIRVGDDDGPVVAWPVTSLGSQGDDGEQDRHLAPVVGSEQATVHVHVAGRRLRVSQGSFFQSSPQSAELLVAAVERACGDIEMSNARVVDAYGGVGLFAATVARDAASVVLIESAASSSADAVVNLSAQNATVVTSRMQDWASSPADLVIADPARSGLGRDGVASVVATGAPVVVLVSCDAASLARDTCLLREAGYDHCATQVIDVFPNTSHIEAVTRFDRRNEPAASAVSATPPKRRVSE